MPPVLVFLYMVTGTSHTDAVCQIRGQWLHLLQRKTDGGTKFKRWGHKTL